MENKQTIVKANPNTIGALLNEGPTKVQYQTADGSMAEVDVTVNVTASELAEGITTSAKVTAITPAAMLGTRGVTQWKNITFDNGVTIASTAFNKLPRKSASANVDETEWNKIITEFEKEKKAVKDKLFTSSEIALMNIPVNAFPILKLHKKWTIHENSNNYDMKFYMWVKA